MDKDYLPKKVETIAARRSARLSERLKEIKGNLRIRKAWWSNETFEIYLLVLVFLVNFYIVLPLFGVPSQSVPFSSPIIPALAKIVAFVGGIPFLYATQIVNIAFYLLFGFSFYLLARFITQRKFAAFIAVILTSTPLGPFSWMRITGGFLGEDGPHIASLAILPLSLWAFISFLRNGGIKNLLISSVGGALIILVSPFGFMVYVLFCAISTFSEILLGAGRLRIARFISSLVITAAISAFWFNPGFVFWLYLGPFGEEIRGSIGSLIPVSFFVVPVLATFGYLLFDRRPNLQSVFLSVFFTLTFLIISSVSSGVLASAHKSRYQAEFGISLSLLIGVVFVKLFDYLRHQRRFVLPFFTSRFWNITQLVVLAVLVLVAVFSRSGIVREIENLDLAVEENLQDSIFLGRTNFGIASVILGNVITLGTIVYLVYAVKKFKPEFNIKTYIKGR